MTDKEHLFTDEEITLNFTKLGELMDALGMFDEELSDTEIRDKDGEEYDLEQCAIGPCVVTTEGTYYSFIEDSICGSDDYREYWVSTWGEKFSTVELAGILTELGGDFNVIQD